MSNPWEQNNPWGKGSENWNRWMAPEGVAQNPVPKSNSTDGRRLSERKKATQQHKDKALNLINYYLVHDFSPPPVFNQIDKMELLAALAERIDFPDVIDQAETNLCGIAAVVHILAEFEPLRYVTGILDLYHRGEASFGGFYEMKLGENYTNLSPTKGLNPADFILLGGIRYVENFPDRYDPSTDWGLDGFSWPLEVIRLVESFTSLRDISPEVKRRNGYREKPKSIQFWSQLFKDLNNLQSGDAQIVLLFDWGRLNGDPGFMGITSSWHYVLYKNGQCINETEIRVDIWHWGKLAHIGESRGKETISLPDFVAGLVDFAVFH